MGLLQALRISRPLKNEDKRYPRAEQAVLRDARRLTEFKRRRKRDVAQVVERLLWEQDVAGSSPVIPIYRMGMYGKPLCLLTMWDFPDG